MASPGSGRLAIIPSSRVLQSPLTGETIWKRLKEAGIDEESIKRRDKAALIAYIAKLEAEIYDHQHHMGLLILEKKELASKYEQIKVSVETAEIVHKRDQAAYLSAIAEARKREESLKKTLGVEKECIASIEKALHEMRAESAETKVVADSKFAEARRMVEDAQLKFAEAEAKLHAAESLQAEAHRYHRAAERKLQEVEAREDDFSRRTVSFKTDCEEKEKEIIREKQSLSERKKILQKEHERLLDSLTSLNEREDDILSRSQELSRIEKELEASRASVEEKLSSLNEEKSNLELTVVSLSKREQAVIEREALLNKKEQELLLSQEKLASKESIEIQKVIANHKSTLRMKKSEFEAELEMKCKLVEDEIENKRRAWELRDLDLSQREDSLVEREHDLEVQSRALTDKEKDVVERSHLLDEKERGLIVSEKEMVLKKSLLQKEKEDIHKIKLDLLKSLSSLDEKKKQIDCANEKLEAMKNESDELSVLEMKLKEELDVVRAQKLELMAEADKLQVEKTKFEAEWELIDEKREELQKEAECVAVEKEAVSKFLKDERDSLRQERDAMRDQHKCNVESLNREREEFMNKMVHEHSEWFTKIQQERADFLLGIEMQKKDLENCIEKRLEELEGSLREREKAFEEEKKREFQHISSLKEKVGKELEQATLEMKRLDAERMEINLDRHAIFVLYALNLRLTFQVLVTRLSNLHPFLVNCMALAFTHLSWWLRSGKHQEPRISNGSSLNSSPDSGLWEPDNLKFPLVRRANVTSSSRRSKRKWQSREERKIDREYDVVLVPSDGGCVSGSESDDSDYSIGWLEPHGPGFQSDDDVDNSFAVLVPCYGHVQDDVVEDATKNILGAIVNIPDSYSAESKKYMERWLSSLQNI